jgi:hypothetical protein
MKTNFTPPVAPQWSPRIAKKKIAKIYEDDAQGFHDAALLNEITLALLMRCNSILMAEEARKGRATCPVCSQIIEHDAKLGTLLECPYCSWTGTWDAYRKSMDGMHLIASGIIPFCEKFCAQITPKLTLKQMLYWIDWLIHRVHWEGTALPGQPGAVCLIKGRAADVNVFLSQLNDGTHRENDLDLSQLWTGEKHQQIEQWRKNAEKRKTKKKDD